MMRQSRADRRHALLSAGWLALATYLAVGACTKRELRGEVSSSRDGNTYLVIDDDNGGHCELIVDGEIWRHEIGVAGRIEPGTHAIDCGALEHFDPRNAIQLVVPQGTVFHFDYWGP